MSALLPCIREAPVSYLDLHTDYHEQDFQGFPKPSSQMMDRGGEEEEE